MKKIRATYIGKPDNRWGFVPGQPYMLEVYSRGNDRVWVKQAGWPSAHSPASYPDIMDFLTNWDDIATQVPV